MMCIAEFGTFLANANTKESHVFAIHRSALQGMKCTKTDVGTFIQHFNYFLGHEIADGLNVDQEVFTFDPGIKCSICMKAFNR